MRSHFEMVGRWMMFGVVVSKIILSRSPIDVKLALRYPILDPIKMHVHGTSLSLFHGVVNDMLAIFK